MIANPWLDEPTPTGRLPYDELSERIVNLLASQNMCVLATSGPDGPLATPMRYFNDGMTIYTTAQAGTPKLRNIAIDPRVSIGIFAPLVSQASSRGAQLFGVAEVLLPGADGFADGMAIYRWQDTAVERGRSLHDAPSGPLIRIAISRVVYTEHWLRRTGYAPRQHWKCV
jgi:hypothetical protein